MSVFIGFVCRVLGIAAGLVLYRVTQTLWGWPGVWALLATMAAIYFAIDAAQARRRR